MISIQELINYAITLFPVTREELMGNLNTGKPAKRQRKRSAIIIVAAIGVVAYETGMYNQSDIARAFKTDQGTFRNIMLRYQDIEPTLTFIRQLREYANSKKTKAMLEPANEANTEEVRTDSDQMAFPL